MEKAKEVLNALEAELEAAMVKVPVTAVQVEVLMENKAAILVRLREALHCMVEIDRAQKVVKVVAPEEDMAKAKEEVEKALAGIVEARIAIPARVGGVFVGHIFGARYKNRAEFVGGAILILIGVKILLEHFGVL